MTRAALPDGGVALVVPATGSGASQECSSVARESQLAGIRTEQCFSLGERSDSWVGSAAEELGWGTVINLASPGVAT